MDPGGRVLGAGMLEPGSPAEFGGGGWLAAAVAFKFFWRLFILACRRTLLLRRRGS